LESVDVRHPEMLRRPLGEEEKDFSSMTPKKPLFKFESHALKGRGKIEENKHLPQGAREVEEKDVERTSRDACSM
jgi:hypothetical protein